jgi:DNA-binding NarL/FixJ family response regulator
MTVTQLVSILLVDDHPLFHKGLQTLLNFYSNNGSFRFHVVGEAATVDQALNRTYAVGLSVGCVIAKVKSQKSKVKSQN